MSASTGSAQSVAPLAPPASAPVAPGFMGRVLKVVGGLVVVGVVLSIANAYLGGRASPGLPVIQPAPAQVNLPPVGDAWFGTSFDTTTFEVRGRLSSVGVQDSFVMVAQIPRVMDGSELVIRAYLDGALIANQQSNATGLGDVWGFNLGPLFAAGTWRYELADIGGNVLASGQLTTK